MRVTDEHVHDSKPLPGLVENIIKSDRMTTLGKVFADDGADDNNDIFKCLCGQWNLAVYKSKKKF